MNIENHIALDDPDHPFSPNYNEPETPDVDKCSFCYQTYEMPDLHSLVFIDNKGERHDELMCCDCAREHNLEAESFWDRINYQLLIKLMEAKKC